MAEYRSRLHQTVQTTATDLWNDSCAAAELTASIADGAVGATSNPTIVLEVLKKELDHWREPLRRLIEDNPTWTEVDVAWALIEAMAVRGAGLLLPIFEATRGKKGRLSIQTNPTFYRDAEALADQAEYFAGLAANMQVKIPATQAGIAAIEEATARGVSVNATVCFTVPQALAVAEAVERGLARRHRQGSDIASMSPVCTIMVGRLDDWLKVVAERDGIVTDPGNLNWAGIACIKRAYGIFAQRGYRTRLLAAAYRHHMHWSELIGGDIILTITYDWQTRLNNSDIEVKPRFDDPVPAHILDELHRKLADFRSAFAPDGLSVAEFDAYGATLRTLRGFIGSYYELLGVVRDFMIPNPDVRRA